MFFNRVEKTSSGNISLNSTENDSRLDDQQSRQKSSKRKSRRDDNEHVRVSKNKKPKKDKIRNRSTSKDRSSSRNGSNEPDDLEELTLTADIEKESAVESSGKSSAAPKAKELAKKNDRSCTRTTRQAEQLEKRSTRSRK